MGCCEGKIAVPTTRFKMVQQQPPLIGLNSIHQLCTCAIKKKLIKQQYKKNRKNNNARQKFEQKTVGHCLLLFESNGGRFSVYSWSEKKNERVPIHDRVGIRKENYFGHCRNKKIRTKKHKATVHRWRVAGVGGNAAQRLGVYGTTRRTEKTGVVLYFFNLLIPRIKNSIFFATPMYYARFFLHSYRF